MTSVIFICTLSALLGYALFAGTSGHLNPFTRPTCSKAQSTRRISLSLGIGAAIAVFFALNWLPTSSPTGFTRLSATTLLICPTLCLIGFFEYRHKQKFKVPAQASEVTSQAIEKDPSQTQENRIHTATAYQYNAVLELESATQNDAASDITVVAHQDSTSTQVDILSGESVNERDDSDNLENNEVLSSDGDSDQALTAEAILRIDTEKHLRITRKALSVLEAETHINRESHKKSLGEVKGKLARSVKESTALKVHVSHERARTLKALNTVARLKKKQVQFKQQIHKSTAARAKALSTANKTIGFARQSLQIRARLESELNDSQLKRTGQEKTINDLSRSLDREKRINQAEVEAMAKQLILREKRASARIARAQVVRGVENNISTRLVKKVAKARSSFSDESDR